MSPQPSRLNLNPPVPEKGSAMQSLPGLILDFTLQVFFGAGDSEKLKEKLSSSFSLSLSGELDARTDRLGDESMKQSYFF